MSGGEPTGLMEAVRRIDEKIDAVRDTQDVQGRQIRQIDDALRGSLDHDELGLVARVGISENAIVRLQADHARMREDMDRPATERRGMVRDAMSGGIGGIIVLAAAAVWEWVKR